MSKIIIGIHGMGNKPPPKTLTRWWQASVREGLKRIKKSKLALDFELVYWAHNLHPIPLKPRIKDKDHPFFIKDPYFPALPKAVEEKPGGFRQKIADYVSEQLDNIFLNEDLTINYESIVDFIIHHFFKDLEIYYNNYCVIPSKADCHAKTMICSELTSVLKKHRNKKIMLIAHSMGSIIAYDVLTLEASDVPIDTFVTIGSPLGLPIIKSRIVAERQQDPSQRGTLKTPENISSHWYNLADLRDKIAINYTLQDDFLENSQHIGPVDKLVTNDYEFEDERNPHKSYGYLRTPEMAEIISSFINPAF
jgi:hypothetical protein